MRGKKPILLKEIADDGIDIAAKKGFQVTSPHNPLSAHSQLILFLADIPVIK